MTHSPSASHNNAETLLKAAIDHLNAGKLDEAEAQCHSLLEMIPNHPNVLHILGAVTERKGDRAQAKIYLQQSVQANPNNADAYNDLGNICNKLTHYDDAVEAYQKALNLKPDFAAAYANLGIAYIKLGQANEAVESLEKAITLDPNNPANYNNIGIAYFQTEQYDKASACSKKSGLLKHDNRRPIHGKKKIACSRIKHDFQQIRYLKQQGLLAEEFNDYLDCLTELNQQLESTPKDQISIEMDDVTVQRTAPSANHLVYYRDSVTCANSTINPALNREEIEARYFASTPEILCVDELLTQEALDEVRNFCLESTIWKTDYRNGYLGTFRGDGFACPITLQIAHDLRNAFPAIFAEHKLHQIWAFKYDSTMTGINIHADFAAVNVNFWITPDDANLDPESGGLVLWDTESPSDWQFDDYNNNEPKIRAFLEEHNAKPVNIAHKQNRAAIFNSTLFHETDDIHFKEGYENRRINITLLFGQRLQFT